MKIKVTTTAILETEDITTNTEVKSAIERAAFNKENDNISKYWAVSEARKYGTKEEITLELL